MSTISKDTLGTFWRHPRQLFWILLAYLPFLGSMSVPLTGDQKLYLSTALEMKQHGSWLKPLLFGEGSYFKPPLQYWATLVGWKIFGFNLWGALIPSVFCVLLTAYFLGEIAELLHERRRFVNAGLWFAITLGAATYGNTAQMEIYVCVFYAASWWAGLRFLADPLNERKWRWLYLAFALAGVSALVKSPLYSVFWVIGYLTYLVISGEWDLFSRKHLYGAWLLGVVLAALWFIVIAIVDGERFWSAYALNETWNKKSGNEGTFWSLWVALLYFCFPFTLMIFPSMHAIWKGRRTGDILRFLVCWSWLPAVFFSLYPYRIKPYLFVLVPALSVLVDWGCFRVSRNRAFRFAMISSGILALAVLGVLSLVLLRAELVPLWIGVGFVLTGVFILFCAWRDWMRGFILAGLAAVFFFRVAAVSMGEQDIAGLRDFVKSHPSTPIAMLDENRNIWHEIGLFSVAIKKPMKRLMSEGELADFVQSGGWVALSETQAEARFTHVRNLLTQRGDSRLLKTRSWWRWKARPHFPFKELVLKGKRGVPKFNQQIQREFKLVGF